uniref:Uncharacterized protein n=1 Tax=Triticum urartu TaxID=4572 RepID=A0A8R7PG49_TRIUA
MEALRIFRKNSCVLVSKSVGCSCMRKACKGVLSESMSGRVGDLWGCGSGAGHQRGRISPLLIWKDIGGRREATGAEAESFGVALKGQLCVRRRKSNRMRRRSLLPVAYRHQPYLMQREDVHRSITPNLFGRMDLAEPEQHEWPF